MAPFRPMFRRSSCVPAQRSTLRTDSAARGTAAYRWLASLPVLVSLTVSGCALFGSNRGEDELQFGVRAYDDGEIAYSPKFLQPTLHPALRPTPHPVRAHKY